MTSELKNKQKPQNAVKLRILVISKMFFLELFRTTRRSLQSIQLKEIGNDILHI